MNKRKELFIGLNALLVIIVGVIVGLTCGEIFNRTLGIVAFIGFLVTLCLPTVLFALGDKLNLGYLVIGVLFIASELATNILFMASVDLSAKAFGITQACLIGAMLVSLMVAICTIPKKEEQ